MPTYGKMLYSFAECREKFGSPYQIEKAIADGRLWKLGVGVYSDTGDENELEIVQWRHPQAVMRLGSKRFLRDMSSPKSNWIGLPPKKVAEDVLSYLRKVLH